MTILATTGVNTIFSTRAPVFICLLGPFRLFKEGVPVLNNSRKVEQLLGILGLQCKQTITRSVLLEALWPGIDPDMSGPQLRGLLFKLRQVFGGVLGGATPIVRDNNSYRLNLDAGIGIDISEFELCVFKGDQAVRSGNQARAMHQYTAAIDLYRGDLLTATCVEVEIERERLRSLYMRALDQLVRHSLCLKDSVSCLNYAYRILASDPFNEQTHRAIMQCHAQDDHKSEALRQFQVCVQILKKELDIEPEQETLALYGQIRLGLYS